MATDPFPRPVGTHGRFAGLLAATALGVYLLVVIGATTALTDGAAACSTWPTCAPPNDPLSQTDLAIAWGHRLAAVVVGVLVVATAVVGLLGESRPAVRWTLLLALGIYPMQIGVGALTATVGPAAIVPGLHLGLGVLIFTAVVLALAWHLERVTGGVETAATGQAASTGSTTSSVEAVPSSVETNEPSSVETVPTSLETNEPSIETVDSSVESTESSNAAGARYASVPDGRLASLRVTARAYLELTKPRLMWLLCLVAAAGMALAAGPDLRWETVLATLGGGVLAIGAAGTFNHVLERDVDRRMDRTRDRPLVSDVVPVHHAVGFGLFLTAASMAAFLTVNALAAALGLVAILFYSVVYTLLLKPNTVQNTVIGGAAGALPALIGWAAVTNEIGVPALALAGVIFLWTPAHFYNLALAYREDYARGGFPMLPVVRGETVTRKHIVWYLAATLVGAVALAAVTDLGWLFAATVVVFGAVFLWAAVRLHFEQTRAAALRSFHASNAFLGATLVVVVLDAVFI